MFKKILGVLLGRTTARAAQFVVFVILARMLKPGDFGLYGIFMTSVLLASTLGSIGLRQAVAHRVGQQTMAHGDALGNLLALWLGLSLLAAIGVFATIGLPIPGTTIGFTSVVTILSVLGAMAVVLMQGLLLGLGRTACFSISDTLLPLALIVSTGAMFMTNTITFERVLIAATVSQIIAGLVSIHMSGKGAWRDMRVKLPQVPGLVRHGITFSVNIFLIALSARLSLYVIETQLSYHEAGLFFAGQRIGDMLTEAATAVGFVLFSDIVRTSDAREITLRNVRISCWILWIFSMGALGMIWLAKPLILLLLGSKYAASANVLSITALSIGPTSSTKVIYPTIAGQGRPGWGSPAIVVSILINFVVCWFLIPRYGLDAASWALLLSQVTLFLGYAAVIRFKFHIGWKDILVPRMPKKAAFAWSK